MTAFALLPPAAKAGSFTPPAGLSHPVVPTDVTGPGGSLGHAQDIRKLLLGPDRNTIPDTNPLVARDGRYCFTGIWLPLSYPESRVAYLPSVNTLSAVIPATGAIARPLPASVFVPTRDLDATRTPPVAEIMQTANADYSVAQDGGIALRSGALLIKVSRGCPVVVSAPLCSQLASVRLSSGAYALVSTFDGHMTVADLSDNAQGACVLLINNGSQVSATQLRVGHMAEVYPSTSACSENLPVAYSVLSKTALPCGLTLELTRFSYPRTLQRYDLTTNIGDCDLRRVLKSAAAISYIDMEREWLGREPYVP